MQTLLPLLLLLPSSTLSCLVIIKHPFTLSFVKPWKPTAAPSTSTTPAGFQCRCGVSKTRRRRIVGGEPANINEFPWQIGLSSSADSAGIFCGGMLISSDTVLTAAHCLSSQLPFVVIREHDTTAEDGQIFIQSSSVARHPDYNAFDVDYDYGIVKLSTPVEFSNEVYPICLPEGNDQYNNRDAVITGWGSTNSGGQSADILQKATLTTLSNVDCMASGISANEITTRMICAASIGIDTCQGDSGGPLQILKSGFSYFEVVGLTSWGFGCAVPNFPGVYSRVTEALDWINSQTSGTSCPTP